MERWVFQRWHTEAVTNDHTQYVIGGIWVLLEDGEGFYRISGKIQIMHYYHCLQPTDYSDIDARQLLLIDRSRDQF